MLVAKYACTCTRYWRSRPEKFPRLDRLAEVELKAIVQVGTRVQEYSIREQTVHGTVFPEMSHASCPTTVQMYAENMSWACVVG